MQKVVLLILAFLVSSFNIYSQCSTCSRTITVPTTSGTNIADNENVCITGTGTISGYINMYGTNSTLCIGENVTVTGGIGFNDATITVTNYGHINNGSLSLSGTVINEGSITTSGTFTVNNNANFTNNGDMDVNSFKGNSGSTSSNYGTISSGGFNLTSNCSFYNYNTDEGAIYIDGELKLSAGTSFGTDGPVEITGNLTGSGGDFTSTYTGENALVVGGNMDLNNSGTEVIVAGGVEVTGFFKSSGGDFTSTYTGDNALTVGTYFEMNNSNADISVAGDVTVSGNFTASGGSLLLDGAGLIIGEIFEVNNSGVSISGSGSGSGCEGISFGSTNISAPSAIHDIDVCNSSDPSATNSSDFGNNVTTCNCSSLLPVEFIGYNTSADYDNELVKVLWSTSSETNSAFFDIEKSLDGFNFYKLGEISAIGNSENVVYYGFNDKNPTYGKAYYRIKQIDIDGNYVYTDVMVQYYENKLASNEMFVAFSEGTLQLRFNKYIGEGSIEVLSVNGQLVLQEKIEVDNYFYSLQTDKSIASGLYIVRFNNLENYWVKKIKVD